MLQSPSWLEQKTHLHGPSAVVKDLHTAIRVDDEFASAGKLLLQAFTMSEAVALAMPHPGTLVAQMLARTAAVCQLPGAALDSGYRDWWEQQVRPAACCVCSAFVWMFCGVAGRQRGVCGAALGQTEVYVRRG